MSSFWFFSTSLDFRLNRHQEKKRASWSQMCCLRWFSEECILVIHGVSILKDCSKIPNPDLTARMNIYLTSPMFHKINHPSWSLFSSFLFDPSLPALRRIICSTINPGEWEYTQTFICKWHVVITFWGGGIRRNEEEKDGERETERVKPSIVTDVTSV